jgi:uncharacterized membrane protein YfcA
MNDIQQPFERFLKFHRRQWTLYLLGCTGMAIGTIVGVLTPGDNPRFVLFPTGAFFGLMIVLALVARVRHRAEFARESKRIWNDEWTLRGMNRAKGIALLAVIFAQAPLMFFMADVSPPSVAGMGGMTIAIGCGTMAAAFLYFTREPQ